MTIAITVALVLIAVYIGIKRREARLWREHDDHIKKASNAFFVGDTIGGAIHEALARKCKEEAAK